MTSRVEVTARAVILGVILTVAISSSAFAANIDVFEMGMTTQVLVDGGDDFDTTLTVINPFIATHHAQLGLTESTTIFDLAWGPTGGNFDFLFDQVLDDSDDYSATKTFGGVGITSDVDLLLDYQYTYEYSNLVADIGIVSTDGISHVTNDGIVYLLRNVRTGGARNLDPPSGTFSTTHQLLLEAGERYGISYSITIDSAEEHGAIGTGSGSLHFTVTPVPEPGTAMLLVFAGFAPLHRRIRE